MIGDSYSVGDTVIVRQWDDMAEEFGLSHDGDCIEVKNTFIRDMAIFCGKELTIEAKYQGCDWYKVIENGYSWSSGMFESPDTGDDADVAGFYEMETT